MSRLETRLKEAATDQRLDITTRALLREAASAITYDRGVLAVLKLERRQVDHYQKAEKETRDACSKKIEELRAQVASLREAARGHQKGLERALARERREKKRADEAAASLHSLVMVLKLRGQA